MPAVVPGGHPASSSAPVSGGSRNVKGVLGFAKASTQSTCLPQAQARWTQSAATCQNLRTAKVGEPIPSSYWCSRSIWRRLGAPSRRGQWDEDNETTQQKCRAHSGRCTLLSPGALLGANHTLGWVPSFSAMPGELLSPALRELLCSEVLEEPNRPQKKSPVLHPPPHRTNTTIPHYLHHNFTSLSFCNLQ